VPQTVAANIPNNNAPLTLVPIAANTAEIKPAASGPNAEAPQTEKPKPSETTVAAINKPAVGASAKQPEPKIEKPETQPDRNRIVAGTQAAEDDGNKVRATSSSKPTGPIAIGSLLPYVEKQSAPTYPPAARTMRASGVVKVEVTVDEEGNVQEVNDASGPALLQASAKDAIRKWKFRPFVIDGQAVKATGFVNFNFSL
jgi:TonB family protein